MDKPSTASPPASCDSAELEAAPLPPLEEIVNGPGERRRNGFHVKRPPEPKIESVADFAMAAIDANVDPEKMRPPRPSYEGTAHMMSPATFGHAPLMQPMPDAVTEPHVSRKVFRTDMPLVVHRSEVGVTQPHPVPVAGESLTHRFTVRLTQDQWEALQNRCHTLRMEGDKVTPGALIRRIVDSWINSPPPKA